MAGVAIAKVMFGLPPIFVSHHVAPAVRNGSASSLRPGTARATPFAVAAYIVGANCFTASTSFANAAVTIARSLSDTFAAIRPIDVTPFIITQLAGAAAATALFAWFARQSSRAAKAILLPHSADR